MRTLLKLLVLPALLASTAAAAERPGSLLVFPCFQNGHRGDYTLVTVTNVNGDVTPSGELFAGTVDVEFVYIDGEFCTEFNRTRRLTPKDTLTVITKFDNPGQRDGYLYVFAKSPTNGAAIKFDWLIGSSTLLGSDSCMAEVEPWVFQGGADLENGDETDLDDDGVRDLNGLEYVQAPDKLHVPRFWGVVNDEGFDADDSTLVLLSLAPGGFSNVVDFLVYNDNEEVFSAQYEFTCWEKVPLGAISSVFDDDFLAYTNQNPNEVFSPYKSVPETGWFEMDGNLAYSTAASFQDPAILAWFCDEVLDEYPVGSQIPFVTGEQPNGDLLSRLLFPDAD